MKLLQVHSSNKYELKYRIEKYQDCLKSLISYRYCIVTNFSVSPITSNGCNTGMSALPDMYAQARGHTAPEGGHIRQCTSSCVAINM